MKGRMRGPEEQGGWCRRLSATPSQVRLPIRYGGERRGDGAKARDKPEEQMLSFCWLDAATIRVIPRETGEDLQHAITMATSRFPLVAQFALLEMVHFRTSSSFQTRESRIKSILIGLNKASIDNY
ncbi:hypothetical protein NDU88_008620 [Pleurodeles waltl]|uniref:Uncharacterized protein n=1 Tax=Pleurodeles waltl TaxID=8319 RepID=A0AAV7QV18_PLEWA|nr:hypothetical protein NDU88_008620 [Pleurodeles waltl]